jgi:hypothetical protein
MCYGIASWLRSCGTFAGMYHQRRLNTNGDLGTHCNGIIDGGALDP